MVLCGLFSALLAICAWISIPVFTVTFTLQTFAVFLALFTLGGKWGTLTIGVYLLLGAVGLPVFSGFRGGFGALLGVTGGFLWGFLLTGILYWMFERLCKPLGTLLGLLACYACGCVWYSVYAGNIGIPAAILQSVVPYLLPDALKISLAWHIAERLNPIRRGGSLTLPQRSDTQ